MFQYLNSDKTSIIYNAQKYTLKKKTKSGATTWLCPQCKLARIHTTDDGVTKTSTSPKIPHKSTCYEWCEIQIECTIQYNHLKDICLLPNFSFASEYENLLTILQSKYDNASVAKYWPSKETANQCVKTIRRRNKGVIKNTLNSSDMQLFESINTAMANNPADDSFMCATFQPTEGSFNLSKELFKEAAIDKLSKITKEIVKLTNYDESKILSNKNPSIQFAMNALGVESTIDQSKLTVGRKNAINTMAFFHEFLLSI